MAYIGENPTLGPCRGPGVCQGASPDHILVGDILGGCPPRVSGTHAITFRGVSHLLDPQNGQKWSKNDHFGPFWAQLGHFVGPAWPKWPKNEIFAKSRKCREIYPQTIPHQLGAIPKGFGGEKIEKPSKNLIYSYRDHIKSSATYQDSPVTNQDS